MPYGAEQIHPYKSEEQKTIQVRRMFDKIAFAYDKLNRLLSLGFDNGWRKKGIAYLKPFAPRQILDIATGTGDLAIAMRRKLCPEQVTGADISEGMMEIGREKARKAGYTDSIRFEQQDCLSLSYADRSFDAVTAAFGVRNFENIEQGIHEMYRVLKPEGHIMILELSSPEYFPMKQLFTIYSKIIIPNIGKWISKEKAAYDYLPSSIKVVPQGRVMTDILTRNGFKEVKYRTFTLGVCTMYTGKK
ncbi:MAG: bifunctional demethylmenaquinone methyltransferase/2-methoxy-6-polyprenyl-1,4-benzoquinol methylase UbiE [Massilibacteroides sp.]|nr:bifunctional demethylmenaquinone methyltransferase/2-methoxy-6-polyprenyl-1,4-benzoquinol methylase UbiE [Massilibacteroides sp.]MDD3062211.1 bifunctional demethylmenaquinone methyltransferase/2-methoxy-6-polyprenyl-1,4-benzoquinol methylase UbiE [Massilibacteroides sp.]MDD4115715.1 bifunctional demethylmenaquinone methyltransferase/2-methoxy-6-polyprenyl-1,4-benzoquinol methylase UbiE [Massilibacteroides sp.]MDD4659729.1 bifunctional demethylmenaquinone methyltransferase/2-methoxy-6-polypren